MNKRIITQTLVTLLLTQASVFGISHDDVQLGGTYMGLINKYKGGDNPVQFDFASNLDVEFNIADNIKGIVQLQGGVGNGMLGFVGPEAAVTDLNIEYTLKSGNVLTMGSFDLPLGDGVNYLTNNADATASSFVANNLSYSALAGPVGTLNTVGTKLDGVSFGQVNTTFALTNGTAEDAVNEEGSFLYLVGANTSYKNAELGVTYTSSNDAADESNTDSNSFDTEFSAILYDINVALSDNISLKSHFGTFSYDDGMSGTQNDVDVASIELSKQYTNSTVSFRYSQWAPKSLGSSYSAYSADIPMPGFDDSMANSANIQRYQFGFNIPVEENLSARIEYNNDIYEQDTSFSSLILALNGSF